MNAGVVVELKSLQLLTWFPEVSMAEEIGMPEHPIVILGAGGKVGKLCTQILKDRKLYTRAVTRSGRDVLGGSTPFVTYASADVTKYDQLKAAIQGASGVILAASASGKNKGGDPAHVDYLGVYNTAKACLECEVPKLAGRTFRCWRIIEFNMEILSSYRPTFWFLLPWILIKL